MSGNGSAHGSFAEQFDTFRFAKYRLDVSTWSAEFVYELDGASTQPVTFREVVQFPAPPRVPADEETLTRFVELLYLAAGTSYYKTAAPPVFDIGDVQLSPEAQRLFRALFSDGLAEFAYRNNLPHVLRRSSFTSVGYSRGLRTSNPANIRNSRNGGEVGQEGKERNPLVPFGGGKDSIVTVELLRRSGYAPTVFAVNPNTVLQRAMDTTKLPTLAVRRTLDPLMIELSKKGALNGHIPVTAINSLLALTVAHLHGLRPVVMSNESSASTGNVVWEGLTINHQWSKGFEAEKLIAEASRCAYFSLLRPLSELRIAQLYARTSGYDHVITSCNAAFRLEGATPTWCSDCPKCRFVFLAFAPFMPRKRLLGIFGKDMLADVNQLDGYRALAGLSGTRPWECVGDADETRVAIHLLSENPTWANTHNVRALASEITEWPSSSAIHTVLGESSEHRIPPAMREVLHALD